jgi:hypothetical protein
MKRRFCEGDVPVCLAPSLVVSIGISLPEQLRHYQNSTRGTPAKKALSGLPMRRIHLRLGNAFSQWRGRSLHPSLSKRVRSRVRAA